jgi:hypothetical protein
MTRQNDPAVRLDLPQQATEQNVYGNSPGIALEAIVGVIMLKKERHIRFPIPHFIGSFNCKDQRPAIASTNRDPLLIRLIDVTTQLGAEENLFRIQAHGHDTFKG